MYEVDLDIMKKSFATPAEKLGASTWKTIFSFISGGVEPTPENIRCFVYGMALHALVDAYAHSAFTLQSGIWSRLTHNTDNFSKCCDNPKVVPMRWSAAQSAASSLMAKMYIGLDGEDLLEFTFLTAIRLGLFI